jgi:hypothetical protein
LRFAMAAWLLSIEYPLDVNVTFSYFQYPPAVGYSLVNEDSNICS